jgi:hypothetical protein
MGIANEQLFMVMVKNTSKHIMDFLVELGGLRLSSKHIAEGISNQSPFRPIQDIIKLSQKDYIASRD